VNKDKRLGRGLAALLGTPDEAQTNGPRLARETVYETASSVLSSAKSERRKAEPAEVAIGNVVACELDVQLIEANPFQPRRDFNEAEIASLAESLKTHQQLQPISVRRIGEKYQLISGERRLRATIRAGLPTIRAEIREADDRLVAELAIIENLQRKDLNAIEKAMSFKGYIQEHRCTQEELANRLRIDRSTVTNFMRLLELPKSILDAVQKELISAGHAKAILSLGTDDQQLEYAQLIQSEGWSVRETERRVSEQVAKEAAEEEGLAGVATKSKSARARTEHVAALEVTLKRQLGTKVDILQTSKGKGRIVIHFANRDEFERLREILDGGSSHAKKTA
jgi:ParB family transcriptional regulator, chromosome partitioning protein